MINNNIKPVKKAVIPAAGYGTRFLPATKALPKEMLPIIDTPSLQYVVAEAVEAGVTDILIVTTRGKEAIENHFDKSFELETILERAGKKNFLEQIQKISDMANIHYVRQKEMKGSGWAVEYAKSFVGDEPFLVLFGDDVIYTTPEQGSVSKQLVKAYEKTGTSILGVQKILGEEIRKYGAVVPAAPTEGRFTKLKGIIEKPQGEIPSQLTSLGRFLLTSDIFEIIENTPTSPSGEIYLTDSITAQAATTGVYAYEFEGRRYDIGDKQGYLEASIEYALRRDDLKEGFSEYLKRIVKSL